MPLYECKISLTYYVEADDPDVASGYCRDAVRDVLVSEDVGVREVGPRTRIEWGWDGKTLVYGSEEPLDDVLARHGLPLVGERK